MTKLRMEDYPKKDLLKDGRTQETWTVELQTPLRGDLDKIACEIKKQAIDAMKKVLLQQGFGKVFHNKEDYVLNLSSTRERNTCLEFHLRKDGSNGELAFVAHSLKILHEEYGPILLIQGIPKERWMETLNFISGATTF